MLQNGMSMALIEKLRWLEEAETFSLQFPINRSRAIAEGRLPPEVWWISDLGFRNSNFQIRNKLIARIKPQSLHDLLSDGEGGRRGRAGGIDHMQNPGAFHKGKILH